MPLPHLPHRAPARDGGGITELIGGGVVGIPARETKSFGPHRASSLFRRSTLSGVRPRAA
jgi:hypothetical protein